MKPPTIPPKSLGELVVLWAWCVLIGATIGFALGGAMLYVQEKTAQAYDLPLDIPPPPKQPVRSEPIEPRWYPFADVTVARANCRIVKESQLDGWSYGDRELINQIVSEHEPGTKFTMYHLKDSHSLPWSFAGRSRQTNVRAFLYGVHYIYPDGSEWDEFRLHGSVRISTWRVKGPRNPMEEATHEELNL